MFDNLGTAIVQAIGFIGVFGFFVYQLLSDGKKTSETKLEPTRKKVNESKGSKNKTRRMGLFGRKIEPIQKELKPKKKGWFK